ncbi:hypothetical protein [Alterisphingorhabdus coralli]|uniref:HTH marR-type domain-containing protein n=1 Tax=Alterisphingorhabdus coralli TaxID=3071408 RepID=A0AA97I292_9SPHN|nr:hypothetical protein [Parasphingorhabdus sp. SCSIO 66989]WOE76140.1 hypothetical protein RB602_05345 [Parasphingorhabdus sp. SCSIO 66989]
MKIDSHQKHEFLSTAESLYIMLEATESIVQRLIEIEGEQQRHDVLSDCNALSRIEHISEPAERQDSKPKSPLEVEPLVRAHLAARNVRDEIFQKDLFGEPSWNILLDLYSAHHAGKAISITSACIASGAPPTTALRHISALQNEGYIERIEDTSDKRVVYIHMTHKGIEVIEKWASALK